MEMSGRREGGETECARGQLFAVSPLPTAIRKVIEPPMFVALAIMGIKRRFATNQILRIGNASVQKYSISTERKSLSPGGPTCRFLGM